MQKALAAGGISAPAPLSKHRLHAIPDEAVPCLAHAGAPHPCICAHDIDAPMVYFLPQGAAN